MKEAYIRFMAPVIPQTSLAVFVAQKLKLLELLPNIERLQRNIAGGRAFQPHDHWWVDGAIKELKKN